MNLAVSTVGGNLEEVAQKTRDRIASDLWFFVTKILGYTFLDGRWHYEFCRSYDQFRLQCLDPTTCHRRMMFAPRGGGKSLIDRCDIARAWLCDPSKNFLLASYNIETSQRNLREIMHIILKNEAVQSFFDNARLAKKLERTKRTVNWQDLHPTHHPDATFTAASTQSGVTAIHVSEVRVDDLIDAIAARSPVDCQTAFEWVQTSANIGDHQILTPWQVVGTRYGLTDTYQTIMTELPGVFQIDAWPGFWGSGGKVEYSYWESKFPVSMYERMKKSMGAYAFAALIQQNPIQHGDAIFKKDWLKFFSPAEGLDGVYERQDGEQIYVSHMTIGVFIDPALGSKDSSSETAIVVVGLDSDQNVYVLDAWAESATPNVYLSKLGQMCEHWNPDIVACEKVGFQSLLFPSMNQQHRDTLLGYYHLTDVTPSGRSKDLRISARVPDFEQGRVWINGSLDKFVHQVITYPGGRTCDLLDAFAYYPDAIYPPRALVHPEIRRQREAERTQGRDETTGY